MVFIVSFFGAGLVGMFMAAYCTHMVVHNGESRLAGHAVWAGLLSMASFMLCSANLIGGTILR